jgi:hypothetical protein
MRCSLSFFSCSEKFRYCSSLLVLSAKRAFYLVYLFSDYLYFFVERFRYISSRLFSMICLNLLLSSLMLLLPGFISNSLFLAWMSCTRV